MVFMNPVLENWLTVLEKIGRNCVIHCPGSHRISLLHVPPPVNGQFLKSYPIC